MFEYIKKLKPYFFSIREIDNNASLDIRVPINWRYEQIVQPYKSVKIKVQDKNDKFTLISLISNSTHDGYNLLIVCATEIIKVNKEEEEKRRLFEQKVTELKELFQKESLDKLKDITFIESYGYTIETSERMVGEGDRKGQDGIESSETEDDRGVEED
jgi:hypothetical protein